MGSIADAIRCPVDRDSAARSQSAGQAPRPSAASANHIFANNVRFLSMAAIIAMHTIESYPGKCATSCSLIQGFKFGTIGFFLVSGFLLGERIDEYNSSQYFTRRLKNILLPWLFWYLLYSSLRVAADFVHGRITLHSTGSLGRVYVHLTTGLQETAYWFVPNLLIALSVLLILRRSLRDIRLGLVFLGVSIFYAINIYGGWVPVEHTRAVFGFVFYLWLGACGAWHLAAVEKWLARIPVPLIVGLILLMNCLAVMEARLLLSLHSQNALNTLRITNQLASVVVVLAIVKIKRPLWPRFVDVRAHTFGLYLTHTVALTIMTSFIIRILPHFMPTTIWVTLPGTIVFLPVLFVAVYGVCLLAVKWMLRYSCLRWTVGLANKKGPARKPCPQAEAAGHVSPENSKPVRVLAAV